MRKKLFLLVLVCALFLPLSPALADNGSVFLPKEETVDNAYYFKVGGNVELNGTVLGDVIVAGGNINITGPVHGDVIVAGGSVRITGPVGGNIRAAGGQIEIGSQVERNILVFGGNVILTPASNINGGVMVFSGNVDMRGNVQREAKIFTGNLSLAGKINNELEIYVDGDEDGEIIIYPEALVAGNLTYTSRKKIDIKDGSQITGKVIHKLPKFKGRELVGAKNIMKFLAIAYLASKLYFFLVLLVAALIVLLVVPKIFKSMKDEMLDDPLVKVGYGFLWLILTPIVSFLALFTIIGIPIAIVVMILYVITLYLVKIFVAYTLGAKALEFLNVKKANAFWILVLGTFIFIALSSIPFLGWLFDLVLVTWALGAVYCFKRKECAKFRNDKKNKKK